MSNLPHIKEGKDKGMPQNRKRSKPKRVANKSASDVGRTLANYRWQKPKPKLYRSWREGGFMTNKNRGIISNMRYRRSLRR